MMNSEWNISPSVSVNKLDFGLDQMTVRKVLGKPIRSFRKTSTSASLTDVYPSFHVYYSADDKLEAIEFFGEDITLSVNSRPIFPGTLNAARKVLPDLEDCFGSYISKTASIGICEEDGKIVSILAGRKGYYR